MKAQYENYLKAVWAAEEWDRQATVGEIASVLGLAPSSVSEAVRKLATEGLVEHAPYGAVTLTTSGRIAAARVVRKHRLIETFLVGYLGYSWDEVHDEAEILEHAVSDEFVARLAERLGHPERDPHGDPIPNVDGSMLRETGIPLAEIGGDELVRIVRVSDAVPGLLEALRRDGIGIGTELRADAIEGVGRAGILIERL